MKRTILCIIVLCTTIVAVNAQTFEGKIIYQNTYQMRVGGDAAAAQLSTMMGDRMEYFIKGGQYKSSMNGAYLQYQVFSKSENRLYTKLAPIDTLYWTDVTVDSDPVLEIKLPTGEEEILGLKCRAVIIKTTNGFTYSYYFNKKYPLESAAYKDHKMGNWNSFTALAKSVPLKTIIENPQFTMISVATEIQPMELKDSDFEIPNLPKKSSPF